MCRMYGNKELGDYMRLCHRTRQPGAHIPVEKCEPKMLCAWGKKILEGYRRPRLPEENHG